MNNAIKLLLIALISLTTMTTFAASPGDKILGTYQAIEEGSESKVRFTKQADGTYRCQIFWLKESTNADGTKKKDAKNPDAKKSKMDADQVVLIESIRYDAKNDEWNDGKIYNPKSGKSYKATVTFESPTKLRVKGSLLGFSKSVYWNKID